MAAILEGGQLVLLEYTQVERTKYNADRLICYLFFLLIFFGLYAVHRGPPSPPRADLLIQVALPPCVVI